MKSSAPEFIIIGQILAPWGSKGEVRVRVVTDFPERFIPSATVYIKRQPATIDSAQWHKSGMVIKLSTIDSPESAQGLQGQPIEIHRSQLQPLPEGQYYHFQIVGLEVWTTRGERLGEVTDVLPAASNDNYVVHGSEGDILIPAIGEVIKSIDLDAGRITIEPIDGLLTLNKKTAG